MQSLHLSQQQQQQQFFLLPLFVKCQKQCASSAASTLTFQQVESKLILSWMLFRYEQNIECYTVFMQVNCHCQFEYMECQQSITTNYF